MHIPCHKRSVQAWLLLSPFPDVAKHHLMKEFSIQVPVSTNQRVLTSTRFVRQAIPSVAEPIFPLIRRRNQGPEHILQKRLTICTYLVLILVLVQHLSRVLFILQILPKSLTCKFIPRESTCNAVPLIETGSIWIKSDYAQ